MKIVRTLLASGGAVATVAVVIAGWLLVTSAGAASTAPAFVQQVSVHSSNVASVKLTPPSNITSGNRLVVLVGVWSSANATASSVTDAAGNAYTELLHFKASDATEESLWSAPITAGGATRPAITVKASGQADIGAAASEYSGLSAAPGSAVVDQVAYASGTTTTAATVASGATPPISSGNDLAIGMYADSGFGGTLTPGSGYTQRSNISGASNMDLLTEDQVLPSAAATPNATAGTGANTIWLMAAVVLHGASAGAPPTAPGPPSGVSATPGDASATVTWTAPSDGGSPITSYTVIPYVGSTAQPPTTVSHPATGATVNGLTNGTAYTFTVSATNAVGTGPESAPSAAVTPSASNSGSWGPLLNWPITAIHSILLNNGKVLQFDGWQQPEPTQVWDPSNNTFTTQTAPDSIFCSGMAELPDGRVLVIGGWGGLTTGQIGIADTSIFDPATQTWTRVADMHSPRWYPDLTELADGRYVAISGNSTNATTWAETPEVYDPSTNQWTLLSGVSTSQVHEEEYPFSYLIPNGNVFTIGPSEDKSFELNVGARTWTQLSGASGVVNGSSVMYRPGQVLYSGGAANLNSATPAKPTTAVIDLNAQTPAWQPTQPMQYARIYHMLTMLADGTVLAVGGEPTAGQTGRTEVAGGVLPSEIWNPSTRTWSPAAATGTTRGYHSTAILMPDATVLVGGSGAANPGLAAQQSSQIYSPPYLTKGPRPAITSTDPSTTYGSSFSVSTPDASSISAVNLVSLGADTHQSDMGQHFVPLSFTKSNGTLTVQAPSSGAYAPPGYYMLFLVNSDGVPSVASFIHIAAQTTAPGAPTGVTAAAAGDGSANVSWTAPSNGGTPITGYTVTPYIGSAAQAPTTVNGPNPPTRATVTGLTNGTAYTFTVTATNSVGVGPASVASNAVTPSASLTPSFVQQASIHTAGASSTSVVMPSAVAPGDRLIVETGIWSSAGATAATVTDSSGDKFVELTHFTAADHTEQSVWTAPVAAGSATAPTITVTATGNADIGVAALDYYGLSSAADASVVDQMTHAVGVTGSSNATVSSGATPATTAGNELALGFYADSGFGDALSAGSGFSLRVNISRVGDMELLAEDAAVNAGTTPAATVTTGPRTYWLMSAIVFKSGGGAQPAAALSAIRAVRRHASAGVRPAKATSRPRRVHAHSRHHIGRPHPPSARTLAACAKSPSAKAWRSCVSLRRAAQISRQDKHQFIYDALLKNISPTLFCHRFAQQTLKGIVNLSSGWFSGS